MAAEQVSSTEYLTHHLTNHTVGSGFWTWNVDTLVMSVGLAVLVAVLLMVAARKISADRAPTGYASFIEWLYDWVDREVAGMYAGNRRFLTALAFTLFTWIVAMNATDLLPIDLPGNVAALFGAHYWRVLPTADLNGTVAMAIVVLVLVIGNAIRTKGIGGYTHELLAAPFGIFLAPANLLLNLVELAAKPFSLAMRLYGNMYAGELIFMLIALLSLGVVEMSAGSSVMLFFQVLFGAAWAIFHVLIVLLQAYIFTALPVVYIAMAEDAH